MCRVRGPFAHTSVPASLPDRPHRRLAGMQTANSGLRACDAHAPQLFERQLRLECLAAALWPPDTLIKKRQSFLYLYIYIYIVFLLVFFISSTARRTAEELRRYYLPSPDIRQHGWGSASVRPNVGWSSGGCGGSDEPDCRTGLRGCIRRTHQDDRHVRAFQTLPQEVLHDVHLRQQSRLSGRAPGGSRPTGQTQGG